MGSCGAAARESELVVERLQVQLPKPTSASHWTLQGPQPPHLTQMATHYICVFTGAKDKMQRISHKKQYKLLKLLNKML